MAANNAANEAGVLQLLGAPDDTLGESKGHHKAGQSMRVQLVQDLTKEMRDSIQHGKAQAVFGSNPHLKFGNTNIRLSFTAERFRREVYEDSEDGLRYQGHVSHNLAERIVEKVTAGSDAALAKLQATMAGLQKEKEDNKVKSNTVKATTTPSSRLGVPKGRVLSSPAGRLPHARSSASLSAPGANSLSSGALSPQPGAVDRSQARRWILIHMLAAKPVAQDLILKRTRIPEEECLVILQKIASREGTAVWKLNDRWYKELDPYRFKYSTKEDRDVAIQTAVKIFDRLRLSKDDKLWQNLLPVEERGFGKILSKLNLSGPSTNLTPLANRHSTKSSSPGIDKALSQVRPSSSSAKKGLGAAERSKDLLTAKTSDPASAKVVKVTNEHDQSGAGSETDMGSKGIARRVPKVAAGQKRKVQTGQYKSNEIITKSDDEDDEDVAAPVKAERKDDNIDQMRVKRLKTEAQGSQNVTRTAVATAAETAKTAKTTPTPAQSSPPAPSSSKPTAMKTMPVAKPKTVTPDMFAGWGNASIASKIKRVARPQPAARPPSSSGQTAKQPLPASPQQQVQKTSGDDSKPKPKVIAPGTVKSSAGLVASPSLPTKPTARGGNTITSATNQAGKRPGLQLSTNGSSTNSEKGPRPNATANELHKRAPSTSTISSAASSVFTPAAHRNSISSSQSSSSMVSTRADARKLKRPADDDLPIAAKPPIKKVQTTKPANTPGSSPLTELGSTPGRVKSEGTPSQVKSEDTSGAVKSDSQSRPRQSTAPTSTTSHSRPTPQLTARPSQPLSARVRLDNLRKQYTKLYTSFVNATVAHDRQTDPHDNDIALELNAISAQRAEMEQAIRSLMDEVEDYTMWNGVPAKFVTKHRGFLKQQVNKIDEELDELQSQYMEYTPDERPAVLKQKMHKLGEDKKGLLKILFPPKVWEFVESDAEA